MLVEQSSRVSVSHIAEGTFSLEDIIIFSISPPSLLAERALSQQRGFGDDADCGGSISCFHPAERTATLCSANSRPLPTLWIRISSVGAEPWSLQPQAAPWCRGGLSEAQIWKPLKGRSDGRPSPPQSAPGIDFFWSLGELEIRSWEISVV